VGELGWYVAASSPPSFPVMRYLLNK